MRVAGLLAFLFFAAATLVARGQQDVCLEKGTGEVLRKQILNETGPRDANPTLKKEFVESAESISELLQRSFAPGKEGEKS